MKKCLILLSIVGLFFTTQSIDRNIYEPYVGEFPLIKEYERLIESEESGRSPVTAFEECPGGVCPLK